MHAPTATILFDFFGTLVAYSPSRTEQGYARTHVLLGELGVQCAYDDFLCTWVRVSEEHDRCSEIDDREYSMTDVAHAVLLAVGAPEVATDDAAVQRLVAAYLEEWSSAVRPLPGVDAMLHGLAREYRLAVVTNTHDPGMVPSILAAMGVRDLFETVVTSVEVGFRKPHPAIYEAAVRSLDVRSAQCVFVGDTVGPDYVGPRRFGMAACLVGDAGGDEVLPADRLGSVLELPRWLGQRGAAPER